MFPYLTGDGKVRFAKRKKNGSGGMMGRRFGMKKGNLMAGPDLYARIHGKSNTLR